MGIFTKIKNILFEEEEIPEDDKKKKVGLKKPQEKAVEKEEKPISKQVSPVKSLSTEKETKANNYDTMSERELFRSENTFPFPDFDEEEFNNSINKAKPKSTNILDYERKKRTERRIDYGRYEKTEIKETIEKKKFKPSPIISPVYGILNEDYKIEDIKDRKDIENLLDIDTVRKKAFEAPLKTQEKPQTTYYEESVTVKIKEPEEEKEKKAKSIDELLEDTSDETINVEDKSPVNNELTEYDEIDEQLDELGKANKNKAINNEDTLENDLFDLIDSMYDDREDGEI